MGAFAVNPRFWILLVLVFLVVFVWRVARQWWRDLAGAARRRTGHEATDS